MHLINNAVIVTKHELESMITEWLRKTQAKDAVFILSFTDNPGAAFSPYDIHFSDWTFARVQSLSETEKEICIRDNFIPLKTLAELLLPFHPELPDGPGVELPELNAVLFLQKSWNNVHFDECYGAVTDTNQPYIERSYNGTTRAFALSDEEIAKIYDYRYNQYLFQDANDHLDEYMEENGIAPDTIPESELNDTLNDLVNRFLHRQDCNRAENDIWQEALSEYFAERTSV